MRSNLNDVIERLENRTLKLDSEEDYAVVEEMLKDYRRMKRDGYNAALWEITDEINKQEQGIKYNEENKAVVYGMYIARDIIMRHNRDFLKNLKCYKFDCELTDEDLSAIDSAVKYLRFIDNGIRDLAKSYEEKRDNMQIFHQKEIQALEKIIKMCMGDESCQNDTK